MYFSAKETIQYRRHVQLERINCNIKLDTILVYMVTKRKNENTNHEQKDLKEKKNFILFFFG